MEQLEHLLSQLGHSLRSIYSSTDIHPQHSPTQVSQPAPASSSPLTVDALLQRNEAIATSSTHQPLPYISELKTQPRILLVTCADPRLFPERFLGLAPGEVLFYRTTGGRIGPLLRVIAGMTAFAPIAEVMIVQHTDCGAARFKDADVRAVLAQRAPHRRAELESATFGAYDDLEDSVRADVRSVRDSDLFPEKVKRGTRGFVFDVKTGLLDEVTA